jgi:hypothetical protein
LGNTDVLPDDKETAVRRFLGLMLTGSLLVFSGVACDDNNNDGNGIDEDDSRPGPGDGNDETGPGR